MGGETLARTAATGYCALAAGLSGGGLRVLDGHRQTAYQLTEPLARRLPLGPNDLTLLSFGLAVAAGLIIALTDKLGLGDLPLLLFALLVFLSALADALDGQVARLRNLASRRGDLLDHTLDRFSDIFLLGGLALSPYSDQDVGFAGLLGVLMLSYQGTQAQALGVGRDYGGLLGRADRLVLLAVLPTLQFALIGFNYHPQIADRYWVEWMLALFALVGFATAAQRFAATWRALGEMDLPPEAPASLEREGEGEGDEQEPKKEGEGDEGEGEGGEVEGDG